MKKAISWVVVVSLLLCVFFVGVAPISYAYGSFFTRGELALLLMENLDLEYDSSMIMPYEDVPKNSPYYEAICACYNVGIIEDVPEFHPNLTFLRLELAHILSRTGLSLSRPVTIPSDAFSGLLTSEGSDIICTVLAHGVMSVDENGLFKPFDDAYASDINFSALNAALDPTTTSAVSLDLAKGSIAISENAKGATVFRQGETEVRTSAGAGIIRQTGSLTATKNSVFINSGTVALTICDLNVAPDSDSPIYVSEGASLTLNLVGENVLSARGTSGIGVSSGAELIVRGNGALTTKGSDIGSGIGIGRHSSGVYSGSVGNITIISGTVTAYAGSYGGSGISGSVLTIIGGTVTATGGGSSNSTIRGGTITISGGTVTAISNNSSVAIGGGTITISGGTVTAKAEQFNAGAGMGGAYSAVKISNATVTVTGYTYAIGPKCESIDIDDSAIVDLSTTRPDGINCDEAIAVNKQPVDSGAHAGNKAKFYVDAYGYSGLSYQWQVSSGNGTWTDVEGQTSATALIPMSTANDGYYYRCILTNGWDNVISSSPAQAYVLAFTKQPESVDAALDDIVSFAVTPSCKDVTYQWQRSYDDGATWFNVDGETYQTLIVNATLSASSAKYRCVITAANGDTLASDIVEINLDTGNMVTYTAQYFLQKADGSGYVLKDQEVLDGISGETATAPVASYDGFSENTSKSEASGTIANDSSLILTRYFDRNTYSISFEMNGGSAIPAIEALYETPVTAPDEPSRYGYTFAGWYADADFEEEYVFDTMPLGGATAYAKWELIGADRGVEYHINGLSLRSSENYETLDSIPNTAFFVEVSVTNLSADATDTIIIACYKENGQFVGMQYLYAKSQVGQTLTFGSYIDNTKGDIAKIKAFVLPTLGSPIPLANSAEVK